jgi:anaerobic magnesium-protoporphyrin IX monomethyl ester cyclase
MLVSLIHGKYFNSWEALGLGYIGGYVKQELGDSVELNFFQGCFDSDETILKGTATSDIVAFSCTSPTYPHTVQLARKIKEQNPKTWIVVGGYHPSAVPNDCGILGVIDQVIVGEGEQVLVDIIKGDRSPIITSKYKLEFDQLAWPDRKLIKNERNVKVAFDDTGANITSFQSHRSCPFRCKYCLDGHNKVLYPEIDINTKAPVRYRDVDDLLDEIEFAVDEYKLDLIKFSDPTWNTSIKWVIDFCERKISRNITVPFYPALHAGLVTQKMTDLMKKANCEEVACGVESGSPKILKEIGKGTTVASIKRGITCAKKSDIIVRGYFILGMPNETIEDIDLTEKLGEELGLDEYGFTILCPYPGTTMYDPVKHKDIDWGATDEYGNDFWETPNLTNKQLHEQQHRLVTKFKDNICWHNNLLLEGNNPILNEKKS